MKKHHTFFIISLLFLSTCIFSACGVKSRQNGAVPGNENAASIDNQAVNQKIGDTSKTGVISENNGAFYLQEAGQTPAEIESYSVDLKQYIGQTVTVIGQYSGDTLFVGEVK